MAHASAPLPVPALPSEPVQRLTEPLARFLHIQAASGIVLLAFTLLALFLANSEWAEPFLGFWKTKLGFKVGSFEFTHSLKHWINDGLMTIFFFVVGLEVKREMAVGELRELRQASLPIAAAIGGMLAPAGLYLAFQAGEPGADGWGIPMATDIAFVVGCLALLGDRVPHGLRILMLSLAIVDDIGAILVIAIGYSGALDLVALALGGAGIAGVLAMQRLGVRSVGLYAIVGVGIWFAFHESGIHATIAGVILGVLTPVRRWVSPGLWTDTAGEAMRFLRGDDAAEAQRRLVLERLERATREARSPQERLEQALHPWVSFVIMPLFAFANAGVPVQLGAFGEPIAVAVMVGLGVGKPVGVVLACFLAVKLGLARLPERVTWSAVVAGGFLAGIGFTMALFIAGLALNEELLDTAKIGILGGSALSAVVGMALLVAVLPKAAVSGPAPAA
ncbi:MAG: Na+/H+ antiporter NhaA [Planctomycetes bacterium]|nr:Na+/H+ antiporter NhaA [Planctomycetota bacterium]